MKLIRAAMLGALTAVPLVVLACSDGTSLVTSPDIDHAAIATGSYRTTIWRPSDSGLTYVDAAAGRYRSSSGTKPVVDAGASIHLDAGTIERMKESLETELAISRLMDGQNNARDRTGAGSGLMRPTLKGGSVVGLGMIDGKAVSLQASPDAKSKKRPPKSIIVMLNGRATLIKDFQYRKERGKWTIARVTTTVLNSVGRPELISATEFGKENPDTSDNGVLDHLRGGLDAVGNGFLQLIQPDALHASTVVSLANDEEACLREKIVLAGAVAGEVAAYAAYLLAVGSCVPSPATCILAVAAAHLAWLAADVALALAIVDLYNCLNPPPPPPPPSPPGGGGGAEPTCYTIDWYVSYDDGATWHYDSSEEVCEQYAT